MRALTISLLAVILTATVGLGWLFDRVYEQYSTDEQHQGINAISVLEKMGADLALTLDKLPDRQKFIQLWSSKNQYKLSLMSLVKFPLPKQLIEQLKLGEPLLLETKTHVAFHYYLASSDELLIVKSPRINVVKTDDTQNYIFTVLFYIALLLLFLLWVLPLIVRLLTLRKTAKSFGEGKLNQRLKISPLSYIRDIEIEFNHMAQRIENLIGDVKLLSNAVSHDLRTPLARIRFGIDTLQEEDDPVLRRRFEDKISNNVDEMTSLVETLLSYARLDQSMLEIKKDEILLTELIANCIKTKKSDIVDFTFNDLSNDMKLIGDRSYVSMLINNLLQNAVIYGNGQIQVTLNRNQNNALIIIEDNGLGIAKEQRENILKPFVRGDAKNTTIKGHGIGLAIVKRIIDWHQGSIEIDDSIELSGAKFTITLPTER
ncbi:MULTISPECIES: ATP-binding protein [unclassified Pseudoalteromonas]|uniref:HAMP domain-containing sensor histidine kinase n=1 Tax=unclassified Pseudoalteromonas TaxID=194690 RepID=UPI0005A636CA|nr:MULTISPECIES: ATP-binding protein [unclassified Pseudoalteromonas]